MNVLFVGDVMLGRLVNREMGRRGPEYPWGDTLPVFLGADARMINLECVISDRGVPWSITPKAFHFRSDSRNMKVLEAAGIDAVSIANNHSLDYGFDALLDMLDALDRAGIGRSGAGRNLDEAASPAFFDVRGKRFALIAFTDNEPGWEAGPESPGVYHVPVDVNDSRAASLFERVRSTRKDADFLVVSAHWGPNWGYRPRPGHRAFGIRLIESGADVVFGHSCHVFQGVEFYGGGALIYSAGNFIDDYAVDEVERNDESFIFTADFEERVRSIGLRPTVIDEFSAHVAGSPRAELIAAKMRNLSEEMGSRAEWDEESRVLRVSPR